ncbi:1-phosphatidylinositol phosphodiesterase [Ceratocystis lukuohia]|uniref:1-phosphatidylinositol phosphodiesterase n=1 Tax=Ceratocystis lukuohia TaxID=2019550 RepID=A0ABR4MAE0_9PEZI
MRFSLFATLAFFAFSQASMYEHIDDFWSFDVNEGPYTDWMAKIDDNVALSSLSIPGTHNSMTDQFRSSLIQTQNVPLVDQLNGGIRYVDITALYKNHILGVYHGLVYTRYTLADVLNTIQDFLRYHRGETILLRIQGGSVLDDTKTLVKFIEGKVTSDAIVDDKAVPYFYTRDSDDTTIPTLGEVRGKIVILHDFKTSTNTHYGLAWSSLTVSNYNKKLAAGPYFVESRWTDVKDRLSKDPSAYPNKLRITHTTASIGASPIHMAARNSPDAGMNALLGQYLKKEEGRCFGIIVMDFPGQYLVREILKLNGLDLVPGLPSDSDDGTCNSCS